MIEFTLFAPYNQDVRLKGSFSEWEDIPMEKAPDGHWRVQVELPDGVYQYKFRLRSRSWFLPDGERVDITDPQARDVDAATQNAILTVVDGRPVVDTYTWRYDGVPLPSDRDLAIYEMHVGDFSGGEPDHWVRGRYLDVVHKLDHLEQLGVNAIELMPVKENALDYSWGYQPRHFFAADSTYGSSDELKRLVDECHGRGIRVILDGVYNHASTDCPLTQMDHDYWFHHSPRDPGNSWGPEFNYEHHDAALDVRPAWKFIGETVRFWIQEYRIDGIRYDAARQIANYDFMRWLVDSSKEWAGQKPFYNIAEHIAQEPGITGLDGPMDGAWHENFYNTVKEHLLGGTRDLERLKSAIDARREGFASLVNVVNYLTNHDHNHVLADLGDAGLFGDEAFRRLRLGVVLLLTANGIPMIWMGEEFGEYKYRTPNEAKIDWSLMLQPDNRSLFEFYQGLLALRSSTPALRSDEVDFVHEHHEAGVLAYTRGTGDDRPLVVVNVSDQRHEGYRIEPPSRQWHHWDSQEEVPAEDSALVLHLEPWEALVLLPGPGQPRQEQPVADDAAGSNGQPAGPPEEGEARRPAGRRASRRKEKATAT